MRPRTMTSRATTSALTIPLGPMVKLPLARLSLPSTNPSTKRSSLPVTSPLIRIPWLMEAVAPDETGARTGVTCGGLAGALPNVGALTGELGLSGVPCGFASSFFHMKHLDRQNLGCKAALRRTGQESRLRE